MSIAYQCWEMGVGSTVGYNKGSSSLPQYVTENSLRCLSSPSSHHHHHEASFVMYMQQQLQPPAPKDMAPTARFSPSPPISATASSPSTAPLTQNYLPEASSSKQADLSENTVTTSSLTSERLASDGESKRLESAVAAASVAASASASAAAGVVPGSLASGSLSQFQGLRVKVGSSSHAKPGVVERIVPGLLPSGGYAYGSLVSNNEHSSESSSSICQASEDSGSCSSGDTGGEEAQSVYRGPLSTMMAALDESLPIKRPGLSKFFGGKSRSFSSLAEVSTVTELAKPNNPYAKRRKMGFNCPLGDKTRSYPPPSRSSGASIAKKLPSNGSRNTLAVAVILGGLQQEDQHQQHQHQQQQQQPSPGNANAAPNASSAQAPAPALKPETRAFPSRSYSLTDLPHHSGSRPQLRRSFERP